MRIFIGLLLLGLTLVGCGSAAEQQEPANPPTLPSGTPVSTSPVALRIPSIQLDSEKPWKALGLEESGAIEVPPVEQPEQLGWYCPQRDDYHPLIACGAPLPGDTGPAVVVGHVNGGGKKGVFYKLAKLKKGETIEIDRSDKKTAVFTVTKVQIIPKKQFPSKAVYGDTEGAELRLITCGDGKGGGLTTLPDGTHSYKDQTIVYAKLKEIK